VVLINSQGPSLIVWGVVLLLPEVVYFVFLVVKVVNFDELIKS
jgi:hypothetical protein